MQGSIITNLLLPVALGVIMLGLGLSLSIADFTRIVRYPKAVLVGLFIQMFVLTGVCFGIALLFRLPPELAVCLMLLAVWADVEDRADAWRVLARGVDTDLLDEMTTRVGLDGVVDAGEGLLAGWRHGQYLQPSGARRRGAQYHPDGDQFRAVAAGAAVHRQPVAAIFHGQRPVRAAAVPENRRGRRDHFGPGDDRHVPALPLPGAGGAGGKTDPAVFRPATGRPGV